MKEKLRINWKNAGYIILLSSVIGIFYNVFSPNGISFKREEIVLGSAENENNGSVINGVDYSKIKAVDIDEAYSMFENGYTFVDSRDQWEFAEGHIKGAVNFPYIEFEIDHPMLSKLDKDENLVIYCSSTECGLSTKLAVELLKLGYRNLYVLPEGWDKWVEKGYPLEQGQ